jgi:hypothetical protein
MAHPLRCASHSAGLLLATCILIAQPAQALAVRVSPGTAEVRLGATVQFRAEQDLPPGAARPAFVWTLVDPDGRPAPPGAGSISADGIYHAPGVMPGAPAKILVQAAVSDNPTQSGTATVTLLPVPDAGTVGPGASAAEPLERKEPSRGPGLPVGLEEVIRWPEIAPLRPRPGMTIPNPPYSLAGLVENRKMQPDMVVAWQACLARALEPATLEEWKKHLRTPAQEALPGYRYALFHGLGMDSQRRLLSCYYTDIETLTSAQVFALSPWVVLGLRNLISATLIDVTYPRTFYPIGLLLDVPLENIFNTLDVDANTPMEKHPYNQAQFRRRFLLQNPYTPEEEQAFEASCDRFEQEKGLKALPYAARQSLLSNFYQDYEKDHPHSMAYGPRPSGIKSPDFLIGNPYDKYNYKKNEVALFAHTADPAHSVRIKAVVITSSGSYRTGVPPLDHKPEGYYEDLARILAGRLGVPFYDLRRTPDPE